MTCYYLTLFSYPLTVLKMPMMLPDAFFDRDAQLLARELLGKVIRHRVNGLWLSARIIETEAYYIVDKGSHASLGYTEKRKALFLDGGHIYMYYARGGDSLNFSAHGPGNAVLIKSAYPWLDNLSGPDSLAQMQLNNPDKVTLAPSRNSAPGKPCFVKHWASKSPFGMQNVSTPNVYGSMTSEKNLRESSRPLAWAYPMDGTNI